MSEPTVLFEPRGGAGVITLNRPKALNALTLDQIRQIDPALQRWAADPSVATVVIEGAGEKAFCAGGDIRALYDAASAGDIAFLADFYREEYRLNRRIKTYAKPYVALIDGITMGGGVGLSVHGRYRVATERTLFAMPETGIGFFPDVGGTFFLPRCPGKIGLYLGLTGARLKAADMLYTGIATHHVPSSAIEDLKAALADITDAADADLQVQAVLARFHQDPGPAPLAAKRTLIDRLFAGDSLDAVLSALEADPDPWAAETLKTIRTKSPYALAVTFRQLRDGAGLDFDQAMALEFTLGLHVAAAPDFREGVRAVIVDKDNAPQWQPPGALSVDEAFGPHPAGTLTFE
ncbi:enoyl-CoA hydratase/isomerase family protein [Azospirillum sp.]|uniref:enoyl-CoA hydratase/isomerase family protein n=1 Tax=Azospirillum sp. TaxID=34012 RepID=UPI002D6411B7|nr:enoyl-CoA hydratase/isomerase family protein [Azospirillum sp.]HYD65084.1 enoyl-CoA hydratase/isomerase family protein [Azospirillum sp.]